jgi:hypothetical protein
LSTSRNPFKAAREIEQKEKRKKISGYARPISANLPWFWKSYRSESRKNDPVGSKQGKKGQICIRLATMSQESKKACLALCQFFNAVMSRRNRRHV